MKNSNQLKNRVDALAPVEEEYVSDDPRKMTDRQLLKAIILEKYNRAPYPDELTPEGSSRLIKMLMEERHE